MAEGKKKSKKKGAIVGVVVMIVVLLLAAFAYGWIALMPGYISSDKAVENYFNAISNEDSKLYKKACFTTKWRDDYNNQSEKSLDDKIAETFSLQSGATYSNLAIVSEEKLDKEYTEKMEDSVKNRYGIDMSVSQIKSVSFTIDTTFDGQNLNSGTVTRYCYKSGGKWFFLADPEVLIDINIEG